MKPKAFIFDLDGVLTDTAHYHFLAWKKLSDELQFKFDIKDNDRLKGVSRQRSFEIILEINNATNKFTNNEINLFLTKKNDYYVTLINQITPNEVLPNIINFLEIAKENGIKLAVASASKNADVVLNLLEIKHYFDYVADASTIKNSKPDPEVFLNCSTYLKLDPAECIGFEDAQAGICAIHDGGMFSVGINVEVTDISPDLILKSTSELDFAAVVSSYEKYWESK